MKTVTLALLVFLGFQTTLDAATLTEKKVQKLVEQIEDGELGDLTDRAISRLIKYAAGQMYRKGFKKQAKQIVKEYNKSYDGYVARLSKKSIFTNIGDHKPLFDWLAITYEQIEHALGFAQCEKLHLTDLKTLNYGLPVVFRPCDFDMGEITDPRITEYRRHFSGKCDGELYHGVAPVVTYWTTELICGTASWGAGSFLACLPIAEGAEYIMQKYFAEKLSDSVFKMACP
jgi:hypothetical protein